MARQGGRGEDIKFLQTNGNHSRAAFNLMQQSIYEMGIGICCVAEPWNVRDDPCWFSSWNGLAAIIWNPDVLRETCILIHEARDFVIVRCGRLYVASVYISPSVAINEFLEITEELGGQIGNLEGEIVVCGDFNARSQLWGNAVVNRRERLLEQWAAQYDLGLGNIGNAPTCIRPQGTSMVDITWHSLHTNNPLRVWQVLDTETMSDHADIIFNYSRVQGSGSGNRQNDRSWRKRYPRWISKDMNGDLFREALAFMAGYSRHRRTGKMDTRGGYERLRHVGKKMGPEFYQE